MRLLFLLSFAFFVINVNLFSQNFNVSEVDVTNYPNVRASFSAFNEMGDYYQNLSSSDFTVNENGYDIPANLINLNCTESMPTNVVLVLDRSNSMNEIYNGETLWQWTVEGAKTFIDNFPFSDSARIAILAFSGEAILTCDFTNVKQELLDSIQKIPPADGSTNYNAPLLNKQHGAIELLKTRPAFHRRAIVFLTDGMHDSGEILRDKEILAQLTVNNIRFYGITLMVGVSRDLESWARQTAGKYSYISSKIALNNIYRSFAEDLKKAIQCIIEWRSPDICDESESYRSARISFLVNDKSVIREFIAPLDKVVKVETDEPIYEFGDPDVGKSTEEVIRITPRIGGIKVSDIRVVPDEFFEIFDWGFGEGIKPKYDLTFPVDKTVRIKVRFTAKNIKKIRQAVLIVDGTPCPLHVQLAGGIMQVVIDEPKASMSSSCDEINIKWSGVLPSTNVDLFYSTNDGARWNLIKSKVNGLSYNWSPTVNSDNITIRVQISDQFSYNYIRSYGGVSKEAATSITVTKNGFNSYVSGYFEGQLDIDGESKSSVGKEDFFVAKFDIEGNVIWARTGGSANYNDRANGVAVDGRGNVFVTGYAYQNVAVDDAHPALDYADSKYMFVLRYNSNGRLERFNFIGADLDNLGFEPEGLRIRTISQFGQQNRVVVVGQYKGMYFDPVTKSSLYPGNGTTPFIAIYDEYLNLIEVKMGNENGSAYSGLIYNDNETGTKFEVGNFTGTANVKGESLTSKGLTDFWVYKYAKDPISQDISEIFEVFKPESEFTMPVYDFGPIVFGQEANQIASAILTNNGKLPFVIEDYSIVNSSGKEMLDFELLTDIIDLVINPGDEIDLNFRFEPSSLGVKEARLVITPVCGDKITLELKGSGSCGGTSPELYDFGDVNLNKQQFDTITCVFQNLGEATTVISPQIRGLHWNDFYLILPDYVKAKETNGRITVKAGECIDLIVRFEPSSLGTREAEINFFVEAPCKNNITKLIGNAIASDVGVTSYNWGERRVRGTYTGEIEIVNNSTISETIENIQFENGVSSGIFEFEEPTLPMKIGANSTIKVNITFNPQDEIDYAENILVFIASRAEPLISNLTGTGFLPKLITSWDCGDRVKVGDTAFASLTITNPSQSSELEVHSIEIQNDDEFYFPNGTILNDIIVDKGDFITIPVLFVPISGGDNSDNFIILADNYDGTFTEEWMTNYDNIICDGLEIDYPSEIDFDNLIICTDETQPITFVNKSKDTDITLFLSQMSFSSGDIDQFELPILSDVVLGGGKTYTFDIKFTPNIKGHFSTTLNIPSSFGNDYEISLTGSADGIVLRANRNEVNMQIGDKVNLIFAAQIPQVSSGEINNLLIKFNFDQSVVGVEANSFTPKTTDAWQWGELENLGGGYYQVQGTGIIGDNQILELFSLDFVAYLNDKDETQIHSEIDYGCMSDFFDLTIFKTDEVCFNDNRIIQLESTAKFNISLPSPNPVRESMNFDYGVGFTTFTKIEIINSIGEIVKTIYNGEHPSGEYNLNISTSELSNGTYFIQMHSGPYSATKQIMIVK